MFGVAGCLRRDPAKKPHHVISMLEHFLFQPVRRNRQRVAFGMTEDEQTVGREELWQFLVVQQALSQGSRAAAYVLFTVWRFGHDKIESFASGSELGNSNESILGADMQTFGREAG